MISFKYSSFSFSNLFLLCHCKCVFGLFRGIVIIFFTCLVPADYQLYVLQNALNILQLSYELLVVCIYFLKLYVCQILSVKSVLDEWL